MTDTKNEIQREKGSIHFNVEGYKDGKEPIIQLGPGDQIYIRGVLETHSSEIVEAMRFFLKDSIQKMEEVKAIVAAAKKRGIEA